MKLLRVMLATAVVVITWLTVSGGAAVASEVSDAACVPADQAHIVATIGAGGSRATFTVQNAEPLCDAVDIGLAAYLKDGPAFTTPQTLFTAAAGTITTGSATLNITLPRNGTPPHCFTQIDAFTGAPLPQVTDTQDFGSRFLAGTYGTVPNCVDAQVEQHSTTTTATTAPTDDSETPPPGVLPTQVSASTSTAAGSPVAVQGEELARTGPRQSTSLLAALGGALLMVGTTLLLGAQHLRRRRVHHV